MPSVFQEDLPGGTVATLDLPLKPALTFVVADTPTALLPAHNAPKLPGEAVSPNSAELDRDLHDQALRVFTSLSSNSSAEPVLAQYCETIGSLDFEKTISILGSIKGAEQIGRVARANLLHQSDRLLMATYQVITDGQVTLDVFGKQRVFHTLAGIERELFAIQADLGELQDVASVEPGKSLPPSQIAQKLLVRLEKYLFDAKAEERMKTKPDKTMFVADYWTPEMVNKYKTDGLLPKEYTPDLGGSLKVDFSGKDTVITLLPGRFDNFQQFLSQADTIVLHVPTDEQATGVIYTDLLQAWQAMNPKERPQVVLYTEGADITLLGRSMFQGFLFCTNAADLQATLRSARIIRAIGEETAMYQPETLSPGQERAYNISNFDLRRWETITADTYQSLNYILGRFNLRDELYRDKASRLFNDAGDQFYRSDEPKLVPERPIRTILDLGTGSGRIAQMLARLGYKVMGLDISEGQLAEGRKRIKEEGDGLRGSVPNPDLAYPAIQRLIGESTAQGDLVLDDEQVARNYLTVQGSFFSLFHDLNKAVVDWERRFPGVDRDAFFGADSEYAFSNPKHMFLDAAFDAAMFNWHTFCEVGSPENQKMVLEQILKVLNRGGELILEIPNREAEPYATALKLYHQQHHQELYGTIRDPVPPELRAEMGADYYPPRYFPSREEMVALLKSAGFEIDSPADLSKSKDIKPYYIEDRSAPAGEHRLVLAEYFITARKAM